MNSQEEKQFLEQVSQKLANKIQEKKQKAMHEENLMWTAAMHEELVDSMTRAIKEAFGSVVIPTPVVPDISLPTINIPDFPEITIPPIDTKGLRSEILTAIERIVIKVPNIPEAKVTVEIPPIKVPKPQVTVNVPKVVVPDIVMPDQMDVKGWVGMMQNDKPVSFENPLPVTLRNPDGSPVNLTPNIAVQSGGGGGGSVHRKPALSSSLEVGQAKIAVTGTRVQLPTRSLLNGVIISALSSNSSTLTVGNSDVATTIDGTGNGYLLEAGSSISMAVDNSNRIWINGVAGDIISLMGS